MTKPVARLLTACMILALGAPTALAFKIEPETKTSVLFKPIYWPFLDHLAQPIHERMSALSYTCAQTRRDDDRCPGVSQGQEAGFDGQGSLTRGTRWNDDPNNSFPDDAGLTWVLWMGDAQIHQRSIGITYPLLYRTHFGDLQFLHGMSGGGDRHRQTATKILEWTQFAYDVARGEIPVTATLKSLMKPYAFPRHFAGTSKESWTVRRLFLNVRDYKGGELTGIPDGEIPMIALGALLHTIQDSYSRSHTTRAQSPTADTPESGAIEAFLDYTKQNGTCHGRADLDAGWLASADRASAENPIDEGAWVIRRVRENAPWSAASERLGRVFQVTNPNGRGVDGGFKRCS